MLTEVLTLSLAIVANSNHQAGGDCFANRATGDTWHVGNEWFCGVVPSTAEIAVNHAVVAPALPVVSLLPVEAVSENNTVSTPEPVAQSTQGNPGNAKSVGNAGENPNGKNTMPLDNAGSNGNGEHGNQGVNH